MIESKHLQSATNPYAPALVETLQTLIAPGRRARLSPFIEATQFQVLFNQRPEPKRRYEHARNILQEHHNDIRKLAQNFVYFIQQGKRFGSYVYDRDFLRLYLTYYLTTNVCKLQLTLLGLLRQKRLSGSLVVMDIGVGAGTTALSVLDFLIAWANTCDLYGAEFPIQSVQLVGIDSNSQCLQFAQKTVHTYGNILAERCNSLPESVSISSILTWRVLKSPLWLCERH